MKLRCGNLEGWNKFWIDEDRRKCKFCGKGRNNMEHYMEDYEKIKDWFRGLGNSKESSKERWDRIWSEDLDKEKGEVLVKIWKTKDKIGKEKIVRKQAGEREIRD